MGTIVAILASLISKSILSQDIHYSQLTLAPLAQNPANSGNDYDLRAVASHRTQWKHISSPFMTTSFSLDGRILKKKMKKDRLAIGLNAFSDQAGGALKTNQLNASLAYHLRIAGRQFFAAGLMFGYAQRSIDYSQLQWAAQYDGSGYNASLPNGETPTMSNHSYLDAAIGMVWEYDNNKNNSQVDHRRKILLGISMYHPHQPSESFISSSVIERKYIFHGHSTISVGKTNLEILPAFQYIRQGQQQEVMVGTSVAYVFDNGGGNKETVNRSSISLGGYCRLGDALVATISAQSRNFTIGMSYDMTTSKLALKNNATGAFEIVLMYAMGN